MRRLLFQVSCFILLLHSIPAVAQSDDYEEISVFVRVQQIGGFDMTGIFSYTNNQFYLPVTDLFSALRINQETKAGFDTISGFFIDENNKYLISYPGRQIRIGTTVLNLDPADMLKTETRLYLNISIYGRAFGLYCTFSFRALSVELRTDTELPAIRELRLQQMRQNVERLRGVVKVDTTIERTYHLFRMGMIDWSVNSSVMSGEPADNRIITGIGTELLWGESNLLLNYSSRDGFDFRNQQYYWRWANNDSKYIKQVRAGKISAGSISTIYDPLHGVTATNAPTKYRRSFGSYTLADYTEPGWSVELYINNVIVDYTLADASGFFSFDIPLVYGNSDITLKFYGPYGEERIREQVINIPFNFLPTGEAEYVVTAGVISDSANSLFSKGEVNYGINRFVTVGGGYEYLSSVPGSSGIPFLKASLTPHPFIMISGEYDHEVVSRGKLSFRNKTNLLFEVDYSKYAENQQAIRFNYLEERKLTVSLPFKSESVRGFTRMSYKQNVYEELNYNTAELTLSSFFGPFNTNITGFGNWISNSTPFISANLAAGVRLGRGFNVRSQAQLDVNNMEFISVRFEGERRVLKNGYLSLNFEQNLRAYYSSVEVSFRYDFPFAQTNISNRYSNRRFAGNAGARGSIAFGSGNGYVHVDNRSAVGRGGITFIPFLDVNHNDTRDEGERLVDGLGLRIDGGRMLTRIDDTLTRVIELEPYTSYLAEIDNSGFENISWQVKMKALSVFVDPNQFKFIEIPIVPMGEINGMVYIRRDGQTRGLGRVFVNIYKENGELVQKILSESDGYFTFLGLSPGTYYAMPDPGQLNRINLSSKPDRIEFEILPSELGDIIDGLDFVLTPTTTGALDKQPAYPGQSVTQQDVATNEKPAEEKVPEPPAATIETPEATTAPAVAPQETPVQPESNRLDITAGRFYVQAGAFPNETLALERKSKIDAVFDYKTGIITENGLFKLRLGYFEKKADAEKCYQNLLEKGFEAFFGRID